MPSRRIRLNEHAFPCNEDVDAILSGVRLPEGFLARMRALAQGNQNADTLGRDIQSNEVSLRLSSSRPNRSGLGSSPGSQKLGRRPIGKGWDLLPRLLDR